MCVCVCVCVRACVRESTQACLRACMCVCGWMGEMPVLVCFAREYVRACAYISCVFLWRRGVCVRARVCFPSVCVSISLNLSQSMLI